MKYLIAPNGKRITGTSESMLTRRGFDLIGQNADGTFEFEYNDDYTDYSQTEEQQKDERGQRLFQDEDGNDWPEDRLKLVEPAEFGPTNETHLHP